MSATYCRYIMVKFFGFSLLKLRVDANHVTNTCPTDFITKSFQHFLPVSYNCLCDSGWSGKNCDINNNECESNPCMNGGTCKDMTSGYVCTCRVGFTGQFVCMTEMSGLLWLAWHVFDTFPIKLKFMLLIFCSNNRTKLPDKHKWMRLQPMPQPGDMHRWRCRLQMQLYPSLHRYENIFENVWYSCFRLLLWHFPQPTCCNITGEEEKHALGEITVK